MSEEQRLRVWTWGDEDYVVAYSAEDAEEVFCREIGADPPDEKDVTWEACPDDMMFAIRYEDDDGGKRIVRQTMAEHAAARGRRYLGSASFDCFGC